jgi:aryl-alcohol dehydrogenase-like predicted oxidoreductase
VPSDDRRRNAENLQEPKLSGNPKLLERLREIGERRDAPPAEAAIAWTLRNPAVSAALAGGRGPEQVDGVVGTADLEPSDDEVREIEGFVGQSA